MFGRFGVSRDPIFWITLGVLALLLVPYVAPGLPPGQLELFADYYAELPLIALVILSCLLAARRDRGSGQRFWQFLAAAFACWLIADSMYAFVAETERSAALQLIVECVYLSTFLLVFLALQHNDRLRDPATSSLARFFGIAGALLLGFELLVYFVVIPYHLEINSFISYVPSFYLFVTLELVMAGMAVGLLLKTESRRWRTIYGLVAVAATLWAVADFLDSLYYSGILVIPAGTPLDVVFYAPYVAMIWACRIPGDASESAAVEKPASASAAQNFPNLLLAYGLVGPAVHLLMIGTGGTSESTHLPRELTVLVGLLTFLAMAFFQHRFLQHRNLELQLDVEELNLGEERLHRQRLESLGLLAGGVAHDFNSLLTSIGGHAELAADELPGDHPGRRHVEQVQHAVQHASTLTSQMLAYAGRRPLQRKIVDLNEIVKGIGALTSSSVGSRAELDYQLAPDLPPIEVDTGQIRQVLLNLITNAAEASESEDKSSVIRVATKCVTVSARDTDHYPGRPRPGRYTVVEVADKGVGLNPEAVRKIFDPFFTTKSSGHGLGLAAVLGIVQAHGGSIQVRSALGEGSRFAAYFRATDKVSPGLEAPSKLERLRGQGTILVVDDEADVRQISKSMLESAGYRVLLAPDGVRALNLADQYRESIRAVLLDVAMPGLGGEKVAQELHREDPATPIVMMSGYDRGNVDETTLGCVAGFLNKPFGRAALLSELRQALGGRRSGVMPRPIPDAVRGASDRGRRRPGGARSRSVKGVRDGTVDL